MLMEQKASFIFSVYLCTISSVALPLNIVVLIALIKGRRDLPRLWVPLASLPISNLIQIVMAFPLPIISGFKDNWIFGKFGIYWFSFISSTCGFSNIFIHVVLSLER